MDAHRKLRLIGLAAPDRVGDRGMLLGDARKMSRHGRRKLAHPIQIDLGVMNFHSRVIPLIRASEECNLSSSSR